MFSDDVCSRCIDLEHRIDQLEAEIKRLKGCKPISEEFIKKHNIVIKNRQNGTKHTTIGKL